jgi:uroporphyrinogen decarboxylase
VTLDQAWHSVGCEQFAVQGNLDPCVLLVDRPVIRRKTMEILRQAGGRPGHIFNLGHGILPTTPLDNAKYLVDVVHELSQQRL